MISKYSTHKTWAFVLERAFSCWYCREFHRSQNLKKDLKGMSCVAFVPLKMMLLSHFWVIEEDRKVFSLLMFHWILCSPFFPQMFQPNLCRGRLHGMACYLKWLFCASLLSVSRWTKAVLLAFQRGIWGRSFPMLGGIDRTQWRKTLAPLFVCVFSSFFLGHMMHINMILGHAKESHLVVIYQWLWGPLLYSCILRAVI